MTKKKLNIAAKLVNLFVKHPFLKLISLLLAVMVWFYVRGEIGRFNY